MSSETNAKWTGKSKDREKLLRPYSWLEKKACEGNQKAKWETSGWHHLFGRINSEISEAEQWLPFKPAWIYKRDQGTKKGERNIDGNELKEFLRLTKV